MDDDRIDGGARAWITVAAGFVVHLVAFGLLYSFTVFFPPIVEEFGRGSGATAWIVSIAGAFMLGASGPSGLATQRFGSRRVMTTGSLLLGGGMLATASAGSIVIVYLSYGVAVGLGAALTFIPAMAAVGRAFDRRRGLALGIAVAGSGAGSLLLAPLSDALIDGMGWRAAVRVLGIAGAVLLLGATVAIRSFRAAPGADAGIGSLRSDRAFRLMLLGSGVGAFGYWVPFVFIVPYAEHHGLTSARAVGLVVVMGVGNTVGRILLGAAADRLGRLRIMRISAVGMAAVTLGWPLATSFGPLALMGIAYGLSAGSFIALLPALAGDLFGAERMAGTTGMMFTAAALGTLLGSPAVGWLFDATGSYTSAILLASGMLALSAVAIFRLPDARAAASVGSRHARVGWEEEDSNL